MGLLTKEAKVTTGGRVTLEELGEAIGVTVRDLTERFNDDIELDWKSRPTVSQATAKAAYDVAVRAGETYAALRRDYDEYKAHWEASRAAARTKAATAAQTRLMANAGRPLSDWEVASVRREAATEADARFLAHSPLDEDMQGQAWRRFAA